MKPLFALLLAVAPGLSCSEASVPPPPAPLEGPQVELLAVDRSGSAVAGASVELELRHRDGARTWGEARAAGETDARGRLSFPKPETLVQVHVRKGDLAAAVPAKDLDPDRPARAVLEVLRKESGK